MPDSLLLDAAALSRALTRIAHEIVERNEASADLVLVGVQTGGVHLARRLAKTLGDLWSQPVP